VVTRTYDVKLTVDDSASFSVGNTIIGNTSSTAASIVSVEPNTLKVKLSNTLLEFSNSEEIHSNSVVISGSASGQLNDGLVPFLSNTYSSETTTASATISSVEYNRFTTAKNADTQNPIVRLISIYYPGEWYPPNDYGNPSGVGEGRAWPSGFPIQLAQVVGATNEDISYNVIFDSDDFRPAPINISGIDQASDGKINELTFEIFNVGNIISSIVENPYISGNNISNATVALVNGEYLHGIDPRTVDADPVDVGTVGDEAYDTLVRARANGLVYDASVVSDIYGIANAAFSYSQTQAVGGTWRNDTFDSRDLLGAVVNIKTTFAQFLDYWPEYSIISNVEGRVVTVKNSAPYRVGDNVISQEGTIESTITEISADNKLYLSNALDVDDALSIDEATYTGVNLDSVPELQDVTSDFSVDFATAGLSSSWSSTRAALSLATGGINFNATSTDSNLIIPGNASNTINGSDFRYIEVKGKYNAGTMAELNLWWYNTVGHFPATGENAVADIYDTSYNAISAGDLSASDEFILIWDIADSSAYATEWVNRTIDGLRIDFGQLDDLDIDIYSIQISNVDAANRPAPLTNSLRAITFNADGTKAYLVGFNIIFQYSLSTPYSLLSASYDNISFDTASQVTNVYETVFNTYGNKMYVAGLGGIICQYSLSRLFDISSAVYDGISFDISTEESSLFSMTFNDTGTKMYIVGNVSDRVFQYSLSTAFDLSTASYDSLNFLVAQTPNPVDIDFSYDGRKMYILAAGSVIFQYSLTTPYDITTVSYDTVLYNTTTQVGAGRGLRFNNDGTKFYIAAQTNTKVFEYTIPYPSTGTTPVDIPLYIVNEEADSESYIEDTFKIDQLESLGEQVASFGLVSWLQYFKAVLPRRRYYKNTCQWQYKGDECQYPSDGTSAIPGTAPEVTANGFFTASNASTADPTLDVCSKSFTACELRNNTIHFGGYPGTGRQVPKA